MRINFVLPILSKTPIGGYRVVFEYADYLVQSGHQATIIYTRRPDEKKAPGATRLSDQLWKIKVKVLDGQLIPWHRFDSRVKHKLRGSLYNLRVPNADVTVATAWQTANAVAALAPKKGRGFYLIQHYETWAGSDVEVDATWRLPLTKIVIARWLLSVAVQLQVEGCIYITNGINHDQFRLTQALDRAPLQVVSLYHREPTKGVVDALEALRLLHAQAPEVRIVMFGAFPRGPDVPDWIEYFENPTQSDLVEKIYNKSSIYLGASVVEGWGLPPAEAMACGCAFVGTDIGGFQEFAVDGRNSLLSPIHHPEQLSKALLELWRNPLHLLELQRAAVEDISKFSWERAGRALVLAFEDSSALE